MMKKHIAFDDYVVLNVQSIRSVTWGEQSGSYYRDSPAKPFFVQVTYKNGNERFMYRTGEQANDLFNRIRKAMTGE